MGNFRKTRQNALILNIVNQSYDHLTANEIYHKCLSKIDNISLGTVYRNLNNLVNNYKIRKFVDLNGVEHFDNLNILHNHFICVKCMKISDVFDKINIPLNYEFGKVVDYEIFYKGVCNSCLKKEEN